MDENNNFILYCGHQKLVPISEIEMPKNFTPTFSKPQKTGGKISVNLTQNKKFFDDVKVKSEFADGQIRSLTIKSKAHYSRKYRRYTHFVAIKYLAKKAGLTFKQFTRKHTKILKIIVNAMKNLGWK